MLSAYDLKTLGVFPGETVVKSLRPDEIDNAEIKLIIKMQDPNRESIMEIGMMAHEKRTKTRCA